MRVLGLWVSFRVMFVVRLSPFEDIIRRDVFSIYAFFSKVGTLVKQEAIESSQSKDLGVTIVNDIALQSDNFTLR